MNNFSRGFTLVELSIVLVILGLLIGGVLTGQSLIRAAELRSVATQQARYITAVQTFRDKYFALPGDMPNATSYWGIVSGSSTGSDSACATSASTGPATCNGDGNGRLSYSTTTTNETYRFWQHLANAGLIEGNYTGITAGSTAFSSTTANSPVGRISGSVWWVYNWYTQAGATNLFDGVYDNFFEFGGVVANSYPYAATFKPEDAYNIDTKLDDGKPATGKIVTTTGAGWASQTCSDATASSSLSANYLLTTSTLSCALVFRQAF